MRASGRPFFEQNRPFAQTHPSDAAAERSLLIDIVKGLAITLVALGHTNQGELSRQWWGASTIGVHLNAFIYAFHMPAFFFVSGVFVRQSVAKRGLWNFTVQKARTLLYPFLVWSILIPLITVILGRFIALHTPSLHDMLLNLVTGNSAWFLPALFVALVLAAGLRPLPLLAVFLLAYLAASFWRPLGILAIDRGIGYLPFVIAGMWLGPTLLRLQQFSTAMSFVLACMIAAGLYLAVCLVTSPSQIRWALLPAGFIGTGMLLLLGQALLPFAFGRWTARVGLASLWVFLLAPFPQGLARAILLALHCKQPLLQLVLPTAAAVLVPTWLYQQRDRFHLNAFFTFPIHTSPVPTASNFSKASHS